MSYYGIFLISDGFKVGYIFAIFCICDRKIEVKNKWKWKSKNIVLYSKNIELVENVFWIFPGVGVGRQKTKKKRKWEIVKNDVIFSKSDLCVGP